MKKKTAAKKKTAPKAQKPARRLGSPKGVGQEASS